MLRISNNASGLLGSGIGTGDTTITLASGAGSKFPPLASGEWFPITVINASDPSQLEIMRVTARSGDLLTVVRAQEGTPARSFVPGDVVELRLTSQAINESIPLVGGNDGTKSLRFNISNVQASATRTINVPDRDVDLDYAKQQIPPGAMMDYAGDTAPAGWLPCHGQAVSRSTYSALFAAIGTRFGAGNGSTTFNLPDSRDRVLVGAGSSYTVGQKAGSNTATTNSAGGHSHTISVTVSGRTLTTAMMPSHRHSVSANRSLNGGGGATNFSDKSESAGSGTLQSSYVGGGESHNHTASGSSNSTGAHTHSVDVRQPMLGALKIIKT